MSTSQLAAQWVSAVGSAGSLLGFAAYVWIMLLNREDAVEVRQEQQAQWEQAHRERADAPREGRRGATRRRTTSARPARADHRPQARVSTRGPSSVIATVCSTCAARLPSAVRSVQPSSSWR
jgi:hypothetical protein